MGIFMAVLIIVFLALSLTALYINKESYWAVTLICSQIWSVGLILFTAIQNVGG